MKQISKKYAELNIDSTLPLSSEDTIEMGERVKYLRAKKNLTQNQLAEISGLSTHTISSVERGVRNLSPNTLVRLSNALEVTQYYLSYGAYKPEEFFDIINGESDLPILLKSQDGSLQELSSEYARLLFQKTPSLLSEIIDIEDPMEQKKAFYNVFRLLEYFLITRGEDTPSVDAVRKLIEKLLNVLN